MYCVNTRERSTSNALQRGANNSPLYQWRHLLDGYEDDIKMDLKEIGLEDAEWIHLAEDQN
jgi:hypothetical protein